MSNASVKSFTDKLKSLLKIINDTLDVWTTTTVTGAPTINANGKLILNNATKIPLQPYLTTSASTFGYMTTVPDRITALLSKTDIATGVKYQATPISMQSTGDALNPLFDTLNLLVFGIAYKRNINLVTDQLNFIVGEVIKNTLFGKNTTKYSKANIFLGNTLDSGLNHTILELVDNDLLFYLMNKIDVALARQYVASIFTKQHGVVGSNVSGSKPFPDYNVDPLGYVIKLHGFLLNKWLDDADVAIAKQALIYAIQNPNITNDAFYTYVAKNVNNRYWKKGIYAPPAPSGGSRRRSSKN